MQLLMKLLEVLKIIAGYLTRRHQPTPGKERTKHTDDNNNRNQSEKEEKNNENSDENND